MINNLPQSPSVQWASGLLQATSSPEDNGTISCGVRSRAVSETGQYCKAGTSYQRVLSLEWKTAYSEIHGLFAERLQGKTGAKSARHHRRHVIDP